MKKLYFLIILLFCSSAHAKEDNSAELKKTNLIQAGEIQKLNKQKLTLEQEVAKQAAELEDSQNNNNNDKNSNDNNSSSNLNSSSSTGQRAAPSNNSTPEQYIGSNKRITQDNANSQMDSKKYINDGENLGITTKDQNTKTNQSPSQATGNSSQQAIISDDNKQSDNQISQREELNLEQQAPPKNIVKLQEDTKVAEEKLAELLSNISNLGNEYTKKKLAFEKLEQREAQLLKQPEIKANAFSKQAQQNRAGSQDDSKRQKELVANSQQQVKALVQKEVESKEPQAKVKVPETVIVEKDKALAKATEKTHQQTAALPRQQNGAGQAAKDEVDNAVQGKIADLTQQAKDAQDKLVAEAEAKAQAEKDFADVKKDLEGKTADLAIAEEGKAAAERVAQQKTADLAAKETALQAANDTARQHKEALDVKNAELQLAQDKLAAEAEAKAQAEKDFADVKKDLEDKLADLAGKDAELQLVQDQLVAAEQKNDEVVQAKQIAEQQLDDLNKKEEELRLIQDKFAALEQAYQDEIAKQKGDAQNKGANTNDQTDLADIVKQRNQLEKQLKETRDSLTNARANLAKSQLDLSSKSMENKRNNVSLPSNRANNTTLKMAQKTEPSTFNMKEDVNTTQKKFDDKVRVLNVKELEFKRRQDAYDDNVRALNVKEPELKRRQGTYDDNVRALNVKEPELKRRQGTYDDNVRALNVKEPELKRRQGTYDDNVRVLNVKEPELKRRQGTYDDDVRALNVKEPELKRRQGTYDDNVRVLNVKEPELKRRQGTYDDNVRALNKKEKEGYGVNTSRTTRTKHNEPKEEPNRITSITTSNVHQRELAKTLKTQEALKSSPGNQVIKSGQVTGEISAYSQSVKTPSRLPVIKGKELAINDEGRLTINKQSPGLSKSKSEVVELKQEGGIQPFNNLKTIDETVTSNSKSLVKVEPIEEVADMKKLKFEVISPQMMVGIDTSKVEQKGGETLNIAPEIRKEKYRKYLGQQILGEPNLKEPDHNKRIYDKKIAGT